MEVAVRAKLRHAFKLREFTYPANLLTIARLLMLPATIRAVLHPEQRWRALSLLGIAMATDAVDGTLARRRQEVSPLGKFLDPVADKLMINTTALALTRSHGFPWWAAAILVGRDLAIILGGALIYRRRAEIAVAHPAGKLTTLSLTVSMLLYIADGPRSGKPALYLSLVPFAVSIVVYARKLLRAGR
ncbi:MAG: hypothetical protein RLZZ387_951 [Chloroflexota bacterium]|jgi:CDP-diacylglycerol--glycerol-3-phosphate 3-phosphatidyltransferase